MTPEEKAEMQAYINEAMASGLKGAFKEFRGHFQEQLSPIAERLNAFEAASNPEPSPNVPVGESGDASPQTQALMERLAKMERQEVSRQEELKAYKFQGELTSTIGKHNPLHGEMVKELLNSRYGSTAVEKDGQWYLPNGSKLSEEVESFFKSDAGQHFVPNPSGKSANVVNSGAVGNSLPKGNFSSLEMMADMVLM